MDETLDNTPITFFSPSTRLFICTQSVSYLSFLSIIAIYLLQFFLYNICQIHKLLNSQLLWTFRHYIHCKEILTRHMFLGEHLLYTYPQHFSALIEHRFHKTLEKFFITA